MQQTGCGKFGNCVELYQPPAPGSPEERLEREIQAAFARMRGRNGKVPARPFYEVAEGKVHPLRVLTRRLQEARAKRVPRAEVKRIVQELDRYVDRLFPEDTDEFPRLTA